MLITEHRKELIEVLQPLIASTRPSKVTDKAINKVTDEVVKAFMTPLKLSWNSYSVSECLFSRLILNNCGNGQALHLMRFGACALLSGCRHPACAKILTGNYQRGRGPTCWSPSSPVQWSEDASAREEVWTRRRNVTPMLGLQKKPPTASVRDAHRCYMLDWAVVRWERQNQVFH
ncbi:hypothetical protein TREES_T100006522 [Tupaia chinensis]|uniref:Uncharacterized protein n=1 Tax=Tupaia chinensis TaxID=246437 RepID=L9KVA6_TUPCH|nr:hypothetical protein TREES_T100006522 [Tupaia chinensis]